MDINTLRITVTVLSFVAFIGILAWAYGRGAKSGFDEAARIPFEDESGTGEARS